MSLTKEECVRARDIINNYLNCDEMTTKEFNDSTVVFNNLINEHFEIIKEKERLEKALDKACELISSDVCINCYSCYFKKECNSKKTNMCIANNMNKEEWKEWCLKDERI